VRQSNALSSRPIIRPKSTSVSALRAKSRFLLPNRAIRDLSVSAVRRDLDPILGGEPLRPAHRDRCHHWCLERCVSTEGSCRRLAGPDGRNATATAHPLPRPFRDTSTMVRRSEIQNNITFTRSFVRAATPMLAIVISLLGASWRSAKGRCTHDVRRLQAAATRTESARKQNPRSACILRLSCGAELEQLRRMGTAEYARFNLSYMN
jgi:hypothetical protein